MTAAPKDVIALDMSHLDPMPDAVTVLRRVADRIATPDKWTRRSSARNEAGRYVQAVDGDATCWCLSGAVEVEIYLAALMAQFPSTAIKPARTYDVYHDVHECLLVALPGSFEQATNWLNPYGRLTDYNDDHTTTHANICAVVKRAAALAASRELVVTA